MEINFKWHQDMKSQHLYVHVYHFSAQQWINPEFKFRFDHHHLAGTLLSVALNNKGVKHYDNVWVKPWQLP